MKSLEYSRFDYVQKVQKSSTWKIFFSKTFNIKTKKKINVYFFLFSTKFKKRSTLKTKKFKNVQKSLKNLKKCSKTFKKFKKCSKTFKKFKKAQKCSRKFKFFNKIFPWEYGYEDYFRDIGHIKKSSKNISNTSKKFRFFGKMAQNPRPIFHFERNLKL
jgi:hypothetical protein